MSETQATELTKYSNPYYDPHSGRKSNECDVASDSAGGCGPEHFTNMTAQQSQPARHIHEPTGLYFKPKNFKPSTLNLSHWRGRRQPYWRHRWGKFVYPFKPHYHYPYFGYDYVYQHHWPYYFPGPYQYYQNMYLHGGTDYDKHQVDSSPSTPEEAVAVAEVEEMMDLNNENTNYLMLLAFLVVAAWAYSTWVQ